MLPDFPVTLTGVSAWRGAALSTNPARTQNVRLSLEHLLILLKKGF
jgi:hypothetical protein